MTKGFGNLIRQAQQLQSKMMQVQEEMAGRTAEASAGGGMVVAVANGKQELVSIKIEKEVVNPEDVESDEYPFIDQFTTEIKEITKPNQSFHLSGRVKEVFPPSTFTRQDSSVGKVMRFIIVDNTGEIMVVSWNEKAEELEPVLKKDVQVRLVNAKAKESSNGLLEVHADATTYIEVE